MRRREADPNRTWPSWMVTYNPADWPKDACHPECAYWEAVEQWQQQHPDAELPEVMPDGAWHPI